MLILVSLQIQMQQQINSSKQSRRSMNKKNDPHEWILNWSKDFTKNIQVPIGIREAFLNKGEPQKCFQHSIILSIYCTVCRKNLCASCMYSTMVHRKHRVIPIENAGEQIKEDIRTFESKIPMISNQARSTLNLNNELLLTLDRNFSSITTEIQQFYEHLKQFLVEKEKEQTTQMKIIRDQIKAQILIYNQQLIRLESFIKKKFEQYSDETVQSKILLTSRSILEILLQSSSFINDNLLSSQKFGFPTNKKKIKQAQENVELIVKSLLKTYHDKDFNLKKMKTQNNFQKTEIQKYGSNRSISSKKNELYQQFKDNRRKNSSVMGIGRSAKKD